MHPVKKPPTIIANNPKTGASTTDIPAREHNGLFIMQLKASEKKVPKKINKNTSKATTLKNALWLSRFTSLYFTRVYLE